MPKALTIERAPESDFSEIQIRRDGEPDLLLESGRLLLKVVTTPVGFAQRWKIYGLYGTRPTLMQTRPGPFETLVVAEEGRSEEPGETTRYAATICHGPVAAWEAMGKIDELKQWFDALGLPVVERI